MQEILSLNQASAEDVVATALALLGKYGVHALPDIKRNMDAVGVELAAAEGQPVLIELIFQALDAIDTNPSDWHIFDALLGLPVTAAQAGADLLVMANCPGGNWQSAQLPDSTILILSALTAAAGSRQEAIGLLFEAELTRSALRFRSAALQLRCQLQENAAAVAEHLFSLLMDGLDHPEIWRAIPALTEIFADFVPFLETMVSADGVLFDDFWSVLHALAIGARDGATAGAALMESVATRLNQSVLAQGAYFHAKSLLDPTNPTYRLEGRFCTVPFEVLDVLDKRSHLCCANWVPTSVGDLSEQSWDEVWNSDTALALRASIHDGSFRYCNKIACPKIAANRLPSKEEVASGAQKWREIVDRFEVRLSTGPDRVNLAYDSTCNLACPSCRTVRYAADAATRARFDELQQKAILPLLKHAKLVFVTGSGDPFASKNFRSLMEQLGPDDYPDLRFSIMTNGMLFTRQEWSRFPALHNRVQELRISLDAATGPTHELLRRGARWPVMERNLAFASRLRALGQIDRLSLAFTVQAENYLEMGDAVELGESLGADCVTFERLTNWGTFSQSGYADRAVFMPSHPDHARFVNVMQDPRLVRPIASLGSLACFRVAA